MNTALERDLHQGGRDVPPILVYIASPYTDSSLIVRELRARSAARYAAQLCHNGTHCFSPIAHGHAFTEFDVPLDFAFWKAFNARFLSLCDEMHVLMLQGWEKSAGVTDEIECYARAGKPILYIPVP